MPRILTAITIAACCALLLAAADETPRIEIPVSEGHRLVIKGNGLLIQPGEAPNESYLRFSNGVRVEGEGFSLCAEVVELDVVNSEDVDLRSIEFPDPAADPQRIVRSPGRVIAEMTSEMRLPGAKIKDSSIRRLGAGGGVVVTVESMRLETEQLVSTDGGVTWSAESRSTLTAIDPKTGIGSEISADYLLYDIDAGRMLARGNIVSRRIGTEAPPLNAESQRFELDLNEGTLLASEGLRLFSSSYQMCCGRINADLENDLIVISDSPHLADSETGRSLDAETIESDLQGTRVTARGNVQFRDPVLGLQLTAAEVHADIETRVITASGKPVVNYRDSELTGETITVTINADDSVTVEIDGPQRARLNLEELEGLQVDPTAVK